MLIGEVHWRRLSGRPFNVIIRGTTEVNGVRVTERIKTAWSNVTAEAFKSLAALMIRELADFDQTQLKNSLANILFRTHVGRGNRFEFQNAKLITSTNNPTVYLVVIDIARVEGTI